MPSTAIPRAASIPASRDAVGGRAGTANAVVIPASCPAHHERIVRTVPTGAWRLGKAAADPEFAGSRREIVSGFGTAVQHPGRLQKGIRTVAEITETLPLPWAIGR
ncbi:hypothetical protein GCM10027167_62530 [Nocardia heshunensis]